MKTLTLMVLLAVLATSVTLTGCNTVKGFGQDLSALGHAMTREAEEHD